jgi:hypothetical protein
MRNVLIAVLLLIFISPLESQHLIGLHKNQVIKEIKTSKSNFIMDNSTVNHTYNYLKYIDKNSEQTLLVFLSDKDICTSTKLMSDYSLLDLVKRDLNMNYKKINTCSWTYQWKGITYLVKLKQEEWFFTIFTSKKE